MVMVDSGSVLTYLSVQLKTKVKLNKTERPELLPHPFEKADKRDASGIC